MRILIITTFFPPLNSIASLRPYSWAKFWTLEGHEVEVLTIEKVQESQVDLNLPNPGFRVFEVPAPEFLRKLRNAYRSKSQDSGPYELSGAKNTFKDKIKKYIIDIFHYLRYKKGIFNACRMPDFMDLWIRPALKLIRTKGKWDVVVSTAGPYAVHIVAENLKKKGLAGKWIADYRDTWCDNYIYPGMFPFNLIERVLEKKLMRSADVISTVSGPFAKTLSAKYGKDKVCVVENGFDTSDMESLPLEQAFPADGKFRIVHTGSIYLGKRDPSPLFQAVGELNRDPAVGNLLDRLEILFVGPRQANLEELIERHQVGKWVKTLGFVSRDVALRMQRDADMLLFLPWNDRAVDGVLTGKIFEYVFSRTPIMAVGSTALELSQKLILDAKAGYALNNVDEIKSFLKGILEGDKPAKNDLDPNFINHYNRKALAIKLLNKINR